MVKIAYKKLLRDGKMLLSFRHAENDLPKVEHYIPRFVLLQFLETVEVRQFLDGHGLRTDVLYPVLNMVQIRLHGGWREFMFVHRMYGVGVRDCARIGIDAWHFVKRSADNAFVQKLPSGVESGVEVHGVHLFEAEWMCANAVAVG